MLQEEFDNSISIKEFKSFLRMNSDKEFMVQGTSNKNGPECCFFTAYLSDKWPTLGIYPLSMTFVVGENQFEMPKWYYDFVQSVTAEVDEDYCSCYDALKYWEREE